MTLLAACGSSDAPKGENDVFAVAAQIMRRILVDHARARSWRRSAAVRFLG
jgi:hypothetical protein